MKQVNVIFQPSGCRGKVPRGSSIIEASRLLGADIESLCGGAKVCGKCVVRVEQGKFDKYNIKSSMSHVSPFQHEIEKKFIDTKKHEKGFRLGCAAKIEDDVLIFVPEESIAGKQVISKAARDIKIDLNPAVKLYTIELKKPDFEDSLGDWERLCNGLKEKFGLKDLSIDIFTLRELSYALRARKWVVTVSVWNEKEVIRIRQGKIKKAYGVAIDIGTTTCAAYLCDLINAKVISTASIMNPQCKYGEDVMARISFHMKTKDGLKKMSEDIIEGVNSLIEKLNINLKKTKEQNIDTNTKETKDLMVNKEDIEDITICFNTAMHHILLGLDPKSIGVAPFPPVIHQSLDIKARDIGIEINPSSYIFVMPNKAGFVGGDNIGVLLSEEPHKKEEMQLIIDIGTNGELILGNKDKIYSSSCATGPAFEGAQLTCGMRAATGAIERLEIDPKTKDVNYWVIGNDKSSKSCESKNMKVKGICGSGILDVLAELYRSGVITKTGLFNHKILKDNLRFKKNKKTSQYEFILAFKEESLVKKDIVITQKDIRQIQLAKGALYAGCKLMMNRMGIKKVDKVKIAGAFGIHIDIVKALIIGLFPDCAIENIKGIGNAAGDGCRAALLDKKKRKEANWCIQNTQYIELTTEPGFEQEFMSAMHFPHMTDEFLHLKKILPDHILNQS